jgi:hypothetical protein
MQAQDPAIEVSDFAEAGADGEQFDSHAVAIEPVMKLK